MTRSNESSGQGRRGRVGDLERDPAVGIEPDLRLRHGDHLLGDVDAADACARELAGDEERRLAGAGAEVEDALGSGRHVEEGRGQRGEVLGRARARPLRPSPGPSGRRIGASGSLSTGQSHGARATAPLRARPITRMRSEWAACASLSGVLTQASSPPSRRIAFAACEPLADNRRAPRRARLGSAACGGDDDESSRERGDLGSTSPCEEVDAPEPTEVKLDPPPKKPSADRPRPPWSTRAAAPSRSRSTRRATRRRRRRSSTWPRTASSTTRPFTGSSPGS